MWQFLEFEADKGQRDSLITLLLSFCLGLNIFMPVGKLFRKLERKHF
jgi:hypothetical protein